jgi:hypothetical protein
MKELEAEIKMSFMNKDPKENAISYKLETIQDIADCITYENYKSFLHDFELALQSLLLTRMLLEESIKKGEAPKDAKVKLPSITWIDDWKD